MNDMYKYDDLIDAIFFADDKLKNIQEHKIYQHKYPNIEEYLNNRFPDSSCMNETLKRIHYKIYERPVCKLCGKPVCYVGKKKKLFATYCSVGCKSKDMHTIKRALKAQREKNLAEHGVEYNFQIKEKVEKRKKTFIEKYGTDKIQKVKSIKEKTKKSKDLIKEKKEKVEVLPPVLINTPNSTYDIYVELKKDYPDIAYQTKTDVLPWVPDYYIPSLNLYIDMHTDPIHNGRPYLDNKKDKQELLDMEDDNKVKVWGVDDPNKRKYVVDNHVDWFEFFEPELDYIQKSIELFASDYQISYTEEELQKELHGYVNNPGYCSIHVGSNKIVKYFTQRVLFKKEYDLYHDPVMKWKLDNNRLKYILTKRSELTNETIMRGFKIMMQVGYSFFNPRLFKWFIEKYNLQGKCAYDPCGGWGHRLLGSFLLDKYIYNDLSHGTNQCVQNMCKWIHREDHTVFYEEDAQTFMPEEDYDCMFTCPPYYDKQADMNTEVYECDPFSSWEAYTKFIDGLFDKFLNKESCKYFGIVIREDMLEDKWKSMAKEAHLLKNINSHLCFNSNKKYSEYLYLFEK